MTDTMTTPCECEHVDHFHNPHGPNDCHAYGAEIDIENMTEIKTTHGTFKVCVHCRTHHLNDAILR